MFAIPPQVMSVCMTLASAGLQAFVVGGAVRDLLMDRTPHDFDVATDGEPERVLELFPHTYATGLKHGTVTVLIDEMPIEVTTFRADVGCSDGRHPDDVVFVDDIVEDLARRDFTMNAMALDPVSENIVDPFGGKDDIEAKKVRAVGDPHQRFTEDGLRCLRAVRFSVTLGFTIDEATKAAIPAHLDVLRKVSMERIRDELCKLLVGPEPARGIRTMVECFMLEAVGLGELVPMIGQTQNRWHLWDAFEHTMAVLNFTPPVLPLRWAALLHDVGKPKTAVQAAVTDTFMGCTRSWHGDGPEFRFFEHDTVGAEMADTMLQRLKFSNEDRERIVLFVREHMAGFSLAASPTGAAIRRFIKRAGKDNLDPLFDLFRCDALGTGTRTKPFDEDLVPLRKLVDEELVRPPATATKNPSGLAIDGKAIMEARGLKPGPEVGRIVKALMERVLDDPSLNTVETLTTLAREV